MRHKVYIGALDIEGRPIAWGRWSRVELGLALLCFVQSIYHLGMSLHRLGLYLANGFHRHLLVKQLRLSKGHIFM